MSATRVLQSAHAGEYLAHVPVVPPAGPTTVRPDRARPVALPAREGMRPTTDREETEMRQEPDTCRVHDIDGTPVRVRGGTDEPLTDADRAAFRALIEACRRRYARDHGWRVLTVDLSNKSAFLTDLDGNTLRAWSGVTRRAALLRAESAGWVQASNWELTSPPDGFWCYVWRRSDVPR